MILIRWCFASAQLVSSKWHKFTWENHRSPRHKCCQEKEEPVHSWLDCTWWWPQSRHRLVCFGMIKINYSKFLSQICKRCVTNHSLKYIISRSNWTIWHSIHNLHSAEGIKVNTLLLLLSGWKVTALHNRCRNTVETTAICIRYESTLSWFCFFRNCENIQANNHWAKNNLFPFSVMVQKLLSSINSILYYLCLSFS